MTLLVFRIEAGTVWTNQIEELKRIRQLLRTEYHYEPELNLRWSFNPENLNIEGYYTLSHLVVVV